MPDFIYFLLRHAALGFGLAGAFMALLLGLDVSGLRGLILNSQSGFLAASVLTFVLGLSFASVQMGMAIMGLGQADQIDQPPGGPPSPAPVKVRPRRGRI